MRPLQLLPFLFLAASSLVYGHDRSRSSGPSANDDMRIPGGLQTIAKLTGLRPDSLNNAYATERVFRSLLDTGPPVPGMYQINPARNRVVSFLKSYRQFLHYLRKENLAPAGSAQQGTFPSLEVSLPLSSPDTAEKARKLLAYFGLEPNPGTENGTSPAERRDLLKTLGIDLPYGSRPIRFSLQTGRLQLVPDARVWEKIVPAGDKSDSLFERFLENPAAMRLYVGLAGCDRSIAQAVLTSMDSPKLLEDADLFYLFGPRLKVEDGRIAFPGSNQSWESMLGLRDPKIADAVHALLKDKGVPLLLYKSLALAPLAVQAQITDSPERLKSYYEVLKPYGERLPDTPAIAVSQELPRILRQLAPDSDGLRFDFEDRIARALVMHVAPDRLKISPAGHVTFTPEILARMLPRPKISPYTQVSFGNVLELLRYLQDSRPEMLTDESLSLLLESPEEAPVFLDLIGDITPAPPVFTRYLEYCKAVSSAGPRGWNVDRTRTSQSIFFLISALRHENAITQAEAGALLDEALQSFQNETEAAFAQSAADFLSTKLLPAISSRDANAQDSLLYALSGFRQRVPDKGEIPFDRSNERLQRMRETVQSQSYTPLGTMLEIYGTLRRLESAGSSSETDRQLRALSEDLNRIRTVQWTPGSAGDKTQSITQSYPEDLKQIIQKMGSWNGSQPEAAARIQGLAAKLHPELSVSLLAYCYAYAEAPGLDLMIYDPDFIRKHRFYTPGLPNKSSWVKAHYEQDDDAGGGYIEGSLAGLGFELCRLQVSQATRRFDDEQESYLAATILFSSRRIPYELRTDRSQEYVALATHLGSRLIRLSGSDEVLRSWIRMHMDSFAGPQRIREFEALEKAGDSGDARGVFTRSELFLLGEAYSRSQSAGNNMEAAVDKLNSIVPNPGSNDYRKFQQEIDQYGILLRSRIGLSRFSFKMIYPYENLEDGLRPQYLYDRLCDLKIRLAELNYDLGLPAAWAEFENEFAVRAILSQTSQPYTNTWRRAEETINMLTDGDVRSWIEGIRNRGVSTASNAMH